MEGLANPVKHDPWEKSERAEPREPAGGPYCEERSKTHAEGSGQKGDHIERRNPNGRTDKHQRKQF